MADQQQLELQWVKANQIHVGERRRKLMDTNKILDLALDIKENGITHPPTVRPRTLDEEANFIEPWVLVAGGRRFAAMIYLGWADIPVLVRETMDELKHRILELHENVKREPMTWDEEALANQEIMQLRMAQAELEGRKITQGEIAAELGTNAASFSRSIAAAEAIQENPQLRKAGNRKAALRAKQLSDNFAARVRDEKAGVSHAIGGASIGYAIVTAKAQDWIREIPENRADLVVTDPPFGIDFFKQGNKQGTQDSKMLADYDDTRELAMDFLADMVPQWFRIIRETGWLCSFMNEDLYDYFSMLCRTCCTTHYDYQYKVTVEDAQLTDYQLGKLSRRCQISVDEDSPNACRWVTPEVPRWVWYRRNSRNRSRYPELHGQNVYETILVCNMGKAQLVEQGPNVIEMDAYYGQDRVHPNQKPIEMGDLLARRFTQIGDMVVDTSYGSGALLAGAAKGRYILGCDSNEAMREPALGLIAKHLIPPPSRGKDQSYERYSKALNRMIVGLEDFTEVEES